MAMPRGSSKTSLCETACLWALLYGHCEFVALIASDEEHTANMLDSIKVELESSYLLLADSPEIMFPIRCSEGIHQRAGGQLNQDKQIHIGWTVREVLVPMMPDSKASGGIIRVACITGRIHGMKYKRPGGRSVHPWLVPINNSRAHPGND